MSTKDKILHSLTRSDLVRRTYAVCRSVPIVGSGLRRFVHAILPSETRLWIRIPAGLGKGLWMYADPRFELGYTNGDHEPWIQDLLKSELSPSACFYDIGAHSGLFCLLAARFAGTSGNIVAIEPDPRNAAVLRANIARNQLSQVTVLEAAVWSSTGRVTFDQAFGESNRTQGRVVDSGNTDSLRITVPSIRLDDLIFSQGYCPPDLIKMDIEGAEWDALQGARHLLKELRPKLLCEIHNPEQMSQFFSYLEQFGYDVKEWKPTHPHYADYRQVYLWAVPGLTSRESSE